MNRKMLRMLQGTRYRIKVQDTRYKAQGRYKVQESGQQDQDTRIVRKFQRMRLMIQVLRTTKDLILCHVFYPLYLES